MFALPVFPTVNHVLLIANVFLEANAEMWMDIDVMTEVLVLPVPWRKTAKMIWFATVVRFDRNLFEYAGFCMEAYTRPNGEACDSSEACQSRYCGCIRSPGHTCKSIVSCTLHLIISCWFLTVKCVDPPVVGDYCDIRLFCTDGTVCNCNDEVCSSKPCSTITEIFSDATCIPLMSLPNGAVCDGNMACQSLFCSSVIGECVEPHSFPAGSVCYDTAECALGTACQSGMCTPSNGT